MKKRFFLMCAIALSLCGPTNAKVNTDKVYKANWKDLDTRGTPEWFGNAKFGIFIHWGLYSVPGWSPKGTYTEWYQNWLQNKAIFGNGKFSGMEIPDRQKKLYGDESTYYDFAKMFKAEDYDPNQWAELFKKSGAKYVVLTSRHHDGFALWPSKEASQARNFPWNSVETGPKRDLVGDYMTAIRKVGLKAGLYYSLYEWYNPLYIADKKTGFKSHTFIEQNYYPQFKDLVNRYKPDLLYADGDWEANNDYWRSDTLMAWLFNKSAIGKTVVINDRWFAGCRYHYGSYYTSEYQAVPPKEAVDKDRPWEEIRGMGFSFGYNHNEDLEDYSSPESLVLMLIDIVSQGGNLCLNVGPDASGKIPVIMQERLLQIGEWLDVNGDAIYNTNRFKVPVQWSDGKIQELKEMKVGHSYIGSEYILKQVHGNGVGMARKEVFFTQKGETLYAIVPGCPHENIVLKGIKVNKNAKVSLLGSNKSCSISISKGNTEIVPPKLFVGEEPCKYASVYKIENAL